MKTKRAPRVSVTLTHEELVQLEILAKNEDRTVAGMAAVIIRKFLKSQ